MASNGVSEGSPRISTSTPTDEPSKIPPEEDESEWEYEYSTTETETFYVTLDLSKADFTSRDASTVNRPGYRGGEKVERAKMYLNRRMSFGNNNNNIDLSSDSDSSNREEESEIPQLPKPKDPPQPAPEPKENDAGEEFDDDHQVQIMELHSQNPIISYKGRIYSGVWSANVGTEILLTRRDEDAPVPALRHLDHDVELLAASGARVTVREVNLKPKDDDDDEGALERRRNALLPRERSALSSLVPPAERWSTRERIDQGNFLARLIALKKERGETDEVTVIAKGVERTTGGGGKGERHGLGKQGHRGKFNLPHGRGPRRAKGSGILRTLAIHENDGDGEGQNEGVLEGGGSGMSTLTPRRWGDLGEQTGGEGDEDEEEEEGEDGEGEDDEVMIMDDLDEEGGNEDESNEDGSEEDEDTDSSGSGSGDSAEGMDLDEI